MEPLLPCVPCPVENFPEASLSDPYQKVIKKRNVAQRQVLLAAARDAANKVALTNESEKREAEFRGAGISQKPVRCICI